MVEWPKTAKTLGTGPCHSLRLGIKQISQPNFFQQLNNCLDEELSIN